jgi:hypothetical protein
MHGSVLALLTATSSATTDGLVAPSFSPEAKVARGPGARVQETCILSVMLVRRCADPAGAADLSGRLRGRPDGVRSGRRRSATGGIGSNGVVGLSPARAKDRMALRGTDAALVRHVWARGHKPNTQRGRLHTWRDLAKTESGPAAGCDRYRR